MITNPASPRLPENSNARGYSVRHRQLEHGRGRELIVSKYRVLANLHSVLLR